MPLVRGRIFSEIGSTGRPKKFLDVVLWGTDWGEHNDRDLDEIELLREYLRGMRPGSCDIRVLVPAAHDRTIALLRNLRVRFSVIEEKPATSVTLKKISETELANGAETALACDADVLVVTNRDWFPYVEDLEDLGLFLTDTGFLKNYSEIFVRGHDVPWAFTRKIWNLSWNAFYHMTEQRTLNNGLQFLYEIQKKQVNADARETGRSLVNNRLPNICFTRDRLRFYEIQKLTARRGKWKRQQFAFEISYYLNFYYPLIYGGFDQVALLVNHCLQLGLAEKDVGATYKGFLQALEAKNAQLHGIFVDANVVAFMKRIGALRHYASHRGSVAPGKVLKAPEKELSDDEADAMIAEAGMDDLLRYIPEGEMRAAFRESLRYKFRVEHYEREGTLLEDVVLVKIDDQHSFIRPAMDTEWNFQNFLSFMDRVLAELKKHL